MSRWIVAAGVLFFLAVPFGCGAVIAPEHERNAALHQYQAKRATEAGDTKRAAAEQRRATHDRRLADEERAAEASFEQDDDHQVPVGQVRSRTLNPP